MAGAAALLPAAPGLAQGFGPRALQPVPANSSVASGHGLFLDGNRSLEPGPVVAGSDISVDLAILQPTRAFRLARRAAGGDLRDPALRPDQEPV